MHRRNQIYTLFLPGLFLLLLLLMQGCSSFNQKNFESCTPALESDRADRTKNSYSYTHTRYNECRAPVRYSLDHEN